MTAREKAINYAGYIPTHWVSMTDATHHLWGSSGRGNPNCVKLIEACAAMGTVEIRKIGKVRRQVRRAPGIPENEGFVKELEHG